MARNRARLDAAERELSRRLPDDGRSFLEVWGHVPGVRYWLGELIDPTSSEEERRHAAHQLHLATWPRPAPAQPPEVSAELIAAIRAAGASVKSAPFPS